MSRPALLAVSALALAGWTTAASCAFLDSFAEARLMGMGGVGAALSNGAASLWTNPAGLALLKDAEHPRSASAVYAPLASNLDDGNDLAQSMLAYAQSPGVGVAWKRLQAGRLYSENNLAAGYGWKALSGEEGKGRLLAGVKIEIVSWDAAPTAPSGGSVIENLNGPARMSVSAGLIYTLASRGGSHVPIGFAVRHLNRPDVSSAASKRPEQLPAQYLLGIGAVSEKALWGLDIEMSGRDVDVRTGVEWKAVSNALRLRGGFRLEGLAYGTNLTFGAGLRVSPSVSLDYAFWLPVGGTGARPQRVSLEYRF